MEETTSMEHLILRNGLPVLLYNMPNTHSVTVGLYIKAGSGYKSEYIAGISHLLEHLHFRRCGQISQEELYYKMESMGSTLRGATYRDFISFTMKVVPQNLGKCIEIFCQLIDAYDYWSEEEMEKEKRVVLNQIYEKEAYFSMNKMIHETVFGKHKLSDEIMGTVDSVSSIGIPDVQKYKKEIFCSHNLLLCITGNVDDRSFADSVKCLEAVSISESQQKNVLEFPSCFHHRKPDIEFVPMSDENYLDVNLSFDISYDKKDRELLVLLNCILGEGVGSRLQRIVREQKGFTSNISSYIEWYKRFAVLHIEFSVSKKMLLPCLKVITDILNEMKCTVSKEDLDVSLPFYTTNRMFYEDDTQEMNFQLAYHTFVLETDFGEFQIANNEDTILAIERYAQELFIMENLSIVVVGNTNRITKKSIKEIVALL